MSGLRLSPAASLVLGVVLVFASFALTFSDRDGNSEKSKQMTVEVFNSTSIALRWSEPKRPGASDRGPCPVQRYVIRLKQDGQKQATTWRFDGARVSVTLHDLRPATVYHVRLLSIDCENKRKTSRWTRVVTSERPSTATAQETRVPAKPTEVRTITMSESVVATWRPPEDGALVRGYIIGYGEGVPDVNWRYVNASQRNVTLRNLKPKTQYVISVRAFNNIGKGQVIYDIVYTKEAPVSTVGAGAASVTLPPPTHLRSRMLSPTTTLLQWTDPSLDPTQRIADERYYNVYYQSLPSGKNLSVIVKALQVTLYDLLPNKSYRFTVRTIKGSATSPFSDAVTSRTPSAGSSSSEAKRKTSETTKTKPSSSPTTPDDNNNNNDDDDDDDDNDDDYEIGRQDVFVVDRPGVGPGVGGTLDGGGGGGGGEAKAKRANTVAAHESLARTLTSSSSSSSAANASSMTSPSDVRVSFRFVVQYRVNAYVTWPERLVPCPSAADDVRATSSSSSGYLFRYRAVDDDVGDYVIRSLTSNFVLLENLVPNTRYKYQVKYLTERGSGSGWSQEATLDTNYNSQSSISIQ